MYIYIYIYIYTHTLHVQTNIVNETSVIDNQKSAD
jgi:hypothetical protein